MYFKQAPINEHLIKPNEVDSVEEKSPGGTGPKNGGASSSNGGVAGAKKAPAPFPPIGGGGQKRSQCPNHWRPVGLVFQRRFLVPLPAPFERPINKGAHSTKNVFFVTEVEAARKYDEVAFTLNLPQLSWHRAITHKELSKHTL